MRVTTMFAMLSALPSMLLAQARAWPSEVACESGASPKYDTAMLHVFFDTPLRSDTMEVRRLRLAGQAVTRAFVLREPIALPDDVVWSPPVQQAPAPVGGTVSPVQGDAAGEPPEAREAVERFLPLTGMLTIRFDSVTGRVSEVVADSMTFAAPLRRALIAAAEEAGRSNALAAFGPAPLFLRVTATPTPPVQTALLHQMQVRYLPFESALRTLRAMRPVYPTARLQSDEEGYVDLRMTITAAGVAAQPEVVRATHPDFGQAVLQAVGAMRFASARAGGCAVSQVVQQRVQFRLFRD